VTVQAVMLTLRMKRSRRFSFSIAAQALSEAGDVGFVIGDLA